MSRFGRLSGCVVACVLACAPAAAAKTPPLEPNDSFTVAAGPLTAGLHAAAIETINDRDYYYFNTVGAQQVAAQLTATSGCGTSAGLQFLDTDGSQLATAKATGTSPARIAYTSPGAHQYGLLVSGPSGCKYTVAVSPGAALTQASPGITVDFGPTDRDSTQRVLVDGVVVGATTGATPATFSIGAPPPAARLTVEVFNPAGDWGWNVRVTSVVSRGEQVLFGERQSGDTLHRFGVVRRAILSPSGALVDSCGEAIAPLPCFPFDRDADGFIDDLDVCPRDSGALAGCPDGDGDGTTDKKDDCPLTAGPPSGDGCPDRDGDGRPDLTDKCPAVASTTGDGCPKLISYVTRATLKKRAARQFAGRLKSAAGACTVSRRVVLRVKGDGLKTYASATSRRDGTFTLALKRTPEAKVYAVTPERVSTARKCKRASSRPVSP